MGAYHAQPTHLGATTMTLCPRAARANGSEPITSARPPVLDQGDTWAVEKEINQLAINWLLVKYISIRVVDPE